MQDPFLQNEGDPKKLMLPVHPSMFSFFQVLAGILKWAPDQSRNKTTRKVSRWGFPPFFMVGWLFKAPNDVQLMKQNFVIL